MSAKDWIRRKLCVLCIDDEGIDAIPAVSILKKNVDRLDRLNQLADDLLRFERQARTRARNADNPILGKRPIHVMPRERPR